LVFLAAFASWGLKKSCFSCLWEVMMFVVIYASMTISRAVLVCPA
jgi:hypothetical protein